LRPVFLRQPNRLGPVLSGSVAVAPKIGNRNRGCGCRLPILGAKNRTEPDPRTLFFSDWVDLNPLVHASAVHCRRADRFLFTTGTLEVLKAKGSVPLCLAFDIVKHARRLIYGA
jgi:hypothetical protein